MHYLASLSRISKVIKVMADKCSLVPFLGLYKSLTSYLQTFDYKIEYIFFPPCPAPTRMIMAPDHPLYLPHPHETCMVQSALRWTVAESVAPHSRQKAQLLLRPQSHYGVEVQTWSWACVCPQRHKILTYKSHMPDMDGHWKNQLCQRDSCQTEEKEQCCCLINVRIVCSVPGGQKKRNSGQIHRFFDFTEI